MLKLPDRLLPNVKPAWPVEIDWNHPLSRGLYLCVVPFAGVSRDLVTGQFGSATGIAAKATEFDATAGRIEFNTGRAAPPLLTVYGEVKYDSLTIDHALFDVNNQDLVVWADTSGGQLRAGIFAGGSPVYASSGSLNYTSQFVRWGARANEPGDSGELFVNGVQVVGVSNIGATDWAATSNVSLIGNYGGTLKNSNAHYKFVYVWDRLLSNSEIASIDRDPYQILRPAVPMVYFDATGGGGGTALTVQSLTQAQTIGAPTLTQHNSLTVSGAAQAQTISQPTLSKLYTLSVNGATQSQSIDNVTLMQAHILSVNNAVQAQTTSQPSLAQHNLLTVQGATQAQLINNISLTVAGSLAVNAINQAQTIGQPGLTQHHALSVNDLLQTQATGNVTLTPLGELSVNNAQQSQLIDAVTLTQHHALTVQSLLQAQSIDALGLFNQQLSVNGTTQDQSIDQPALTQAHILSVDSLTQSQLIDAVSLGGAVIGYLNGEIVVAALYDGEITISKLYDGNITLN